jgi:putative ABC transport system ATP-binding protein
LIEARKASLAYQDHGRTIYACREIDLKISPGEFVGILGPSGSGKSSLLYLLSGMRVPTSGEVAYKGQSLHGGTDLERSMRRLNEFGFVYQLPHLIGYLSALENVILACPGRDVREEAERLLGELGLKDMTHRRPHEMSGGQKQRVCVARALVGGRSVIFADEPTAALDQMNGIQVVDMLARNRGEGALVMVTHDPVMLSKADRVIQLVDGRVDPRVS